MISTDPDLESTERTFNAKDKYHQIPFFLISQNLVNVPAPLKTAIKSWKKMAQKR